MPRHPAPFAPARWTGRAAGAAVAACAAALLGWALSGPVPAPEAKDAPRLQRAAPGPGGGWAPQAPSRIAAEAPVPHEAALRAAEGRPRPDPAAGHPAHGPQVCGWGTVELPADDPFPLQRIPPVARRAALEDAERWMGAHADLRVRAAGLLIGSRGIATGARTRVDQLARLAAGSRDAVVYALALQACQARADAPSGCGLLGLPQAALLEPDNALPWLALAADAAARQDADAEHDAMHQAARATHLSAHPPTLPVLVARALDDPHAALQRTLALGVAQGLQDSWRLGAAGGGTAQARAYCLARGSEAEGPPRGSEAGGEPDTSARAPACRSLALLLLQRGRGVDELGAGLDIARRWAFAPPGLPAWQQEHDALVDTAPPLADGIDLGCGAQQRQLAWLQRIALAGERTALREQLAASGHTIAEWSERHRRSLMLAQATAEAVAPSPDADAPR